MQVENCNNQLDDHLLAISTSTMHLKMKKKIKKDYKKAKEEYAESSTDII